MEITFYSPFYGVCNASEFFYIWIIVSGKPCFIPRVRTRAPLVFSGRLSYLFCHLLLRFRFLKKICNCNRVGSVWNWNLMYVYVSDDVKYDEFCFILLILLPNYIGVTFSWRKSCSYRILWCFLGMHLLCVEYFCTSSHRGFVHVGCLYLFARFILIIGWSWEIG